MTMIAVGQVPLYKDFMGLEAQRFQTLKTVIRVFLDRGTESIFFQVAQTPWATKALMGALSDALPLFGFHKRSYIIITAILGLGALCFLSGESLVFLCFFQNGLVYFREGKCDGLVKFLLLQL